MTDDVRIAFHLAWLVGAWHLVVAGWLVFFAEKHTTLLSVTAIVKGILGACIYLIVRQPEWAFYTPFRPHLLPLTLVTLFAFSVLVTVLIFKLYDLATPWKRLGQLYHRIAS